MANYLKELEQHVNNILKPECQVTKVEMEGPEVIVYTKNPKAFYERDEYASSLASKLKKRVKIRTDSTLLRPQKEAEDRIREIIPNEAEVTDIKFLDAFNTVNIEAVKLGLVIGKGGETLKRIALETGWTPELLRAPLRPSPILTGIRHHLYKHAAERKKILKNVADKIHEEVTPEEKKKNYLKITALGSFREVGRSCVLLETAFSKVILDCGINVAKTDPSEAYPRLDTLEFPLSEIDAVVIGHAHTDHSGFLPYLYAMGCKAPVYCTEPTRDLMALLQLDGLNVTAKEGKQPPYSEKDIQQTLKYCIPVEYEKATDITKDLRIKLFNAGHILGSATVHVHEVFGDYNLVYSGDIKYGFTRLFEPASTNYPRVEGMIIESTYGGVKDSMQSRKDSEEKLLHTANKVLERGGNLLIPVFAVGRAQEIMLVLEQYHTQGRLKKCDVYTDGMVKQASAIHTAHPDYLKPNIKKRTLRNDSPFISELFKEIEQGTERRDLVKEGGKIIIASSGMLTGGASLEYFKLMADNPRNGMVFVGWQADGSLGRRIQNQSRELQITDENGKIKSLQINLSVDSIHGFSGHSDRRELINFIGKIKPKRVLVNHGEEKSTAMLVNHLQNNMKIESYAPRIMDSLRLE